ncbi:hypothetical protein ACWD0A_32215 [Streptomyces sp. NPDC002867]
MTKTRQALPETQGAIADTFGIEGMGHTLPTALNDRLADEILHHTGRG